MDTKTKKKRIKKKTALVICGDRRQFWTTQKQFWRWVREGVVVKTGDQPLTGSFNREHEELLVVLCNAILRTYIHNMPNFRMGFHTTFDWSGHLAPHMRDYYKTSKSPGELDWSAIGSDWSAVGSDLESTLEEIERRKLTAAQ